ncbi:MMPL family transporter [Roseimicrobium sp. ORNL1]|uniref:MMPL family transporter n=1 Tax=Roseimicrobium sp. ORNL1 TaxID=2711231 RepID=UPI0013E1D4B0|nr:MMPL family transporter [Roseimicrobium sp. ORNL1]QIF02753.1 MMPL family transporter [Roseimicrobium sp. ORNL1]
MDPDVLSTLPGDLPEVGALRTLRDGFAGGGDLVLSVEASEAEMARAATAALAAKFRKAPALCRAVQEGDAMENSETGGALLAWALQNGNPLKLEAVRKRLEMPEALPKHLEHVLEELASSPDPGTVQRWQYDPLGLLEGVDLGQMMAFQEAGLGASSADGTFRMLFLTPKEKLSGYREAEKWLKEVDQVVAAWRSSDAKFSDVVVRTTGEPVFMAEIGGGIERDLSGTLGLGTALIAALYWFMHRRWKPLFWILLLMGVSILFSLSLAGWTVGKLTVMSLGFASIVLGIVVDYGVLILQEARTHPDLDAPGVRRLAMPGILAGAATNSAVFFALLFISLPGLAELGLLVGMNVVTGALVMLTFMPHVAVRHRVLDGDRDATRAGKVTHRYALIGTVVMVVGVAAVLFGKGLPSFEGGAAVLRPMHSKAAENWDLVQQRLGKAGVSTVPLVLTFEDATKARDTAAEMEKSLAKLRQEGVIQEFALPSAFLPHEGYQRSNESGMGWFVKHQQMLEEAVLKEGFTEETLVLSRGVMTAWRKSLADAEAKPTARAAAAPAPEAQDLLRRFIGREGTGEGKLVALGFVQMAGQPGSPDPVKLAELNERLSSQPGVHLAAWESLGQALSKRVQQDITREMLPIIAILLIMLSLAYRNWRDLLLSVLILALGVAALMATMSLLGKSWNLASLAALPLLLGTGIDYGIHTLLAMKRDGNDVRRVRNTTGRAVFFCGATTVIGFMSLVVADNRGVASLGTACAAGTVWILLLVLWLLPHWRCWIFGDKPSEPRTKH